MEMVQALFCSPRPKRGAFCFLRLEKCDTKFRQPSIFCGIENAFLNVKQFDTFDI